MPELPEVESLRRSLEPFVIDSQIISINVNHPKIVSSSGTTRIGNPDKVQEFQNVAIGSKITGLSRRAKNIMIELDSGGAFLVHLKMTGQLVFESNFDNIPTILGGHPIQESESKLPNKHTYIIFQLDNGTLYYNDVRQFGYVLYYPSFQAILDAGHFGADLGLEPTSDNFSLECFAKALKSKKSPIKKVFLDQTIVVGLGNIYADEVCFAAGILPTRSCNSLEFLEVTRLYMAIKKIIPLAIEEGGSSIANYLLGDGTRGNYAKYHNVYGRKGKACFICNKALSSCVLSSRTTVYCEICQA
jgi:formamidopyrimidine-DNA glycosylase